MKLPLLTILLGLFACAKLLAAPVHIVSEEWPPFIYSQDGELKGADKEITEQVLSQLGYQVTWQLMPWRRVLHDVATGAADAILDIAPHADHQDAYLFTTEPLSSHETVLFHDLRRPFAFNDLPDLAGLVVGVSPGYLYNNPEFINSDDFFREPAPSFEANLQKLLRGRVDLVAMSRPVGIYTSRVLGVEDQLGFHATPLSTSDFYLAFHRADKWQDTAQRFSEALDQFKNTEEYREILRKYALELQDGRLSLAAP
ncbi:MAG: transporter substrate-binding domain-containing protein [Pseudoalteromonas distincta]